MNVYDEVLYNTSREFFRPLQGEEKYLTDGFKEIALIYGATEESFRKTGVLINRIRHQEEGGGTPSRTIREHTEHEGSKIQEHLEEKVRTIFQENDFTEAGEPQGVIRELFGQSVPLVKEESLNDIVLDFDISDTFKPEILNNPVPYEDAKEAVNISVDEVGAKKQRENREKKTQDPPSEKKRKYVQNTIIHVEQAGASYILNGYGVLCVLRILLAFLLNNDLLGNTLIFFVDGRSLYTTVVQFFSWHNNITVILDWYHLRKRCKELLSMALKGREIRNTVLEKLMPLLWHGLVDEAINYLNNLPATQIKNTEEIEHLISYLERNRPMIPAYAVRRALGLRNSSNRGEKSNDLIVADRQKHNGMSWSQSGSVALASVTALKKNNEYKKWFQEGEIEFKLAS
ncbi:MAG: hypothetical protein ACE5IY_21920 [bacterium]